MAMSLRKRVQSKLHIAPNGKDDSKILGEMLHKSTKTKCKKNKTNSSQAITPSSDTQSIFPTISSVTYRTRCPCERHYEKQLLENSYQITVDKVFDLIFGSNEFVRTYHEAQRFYDESATEWLINDATNYRERTLKYKVPYESAVFGKGTILTREKQTLFFEVPGSHYVLEAEVYSEGVRFSDTFTLIIRYCLLQIAPMTTNLRVTAQIIFNKSVSGVIKPLIERNAYSASQEGLKDLNSRLNLIENYKIEKRRLSRTESSLTFPSPTPLPPPPAEAIHRSKEDHFPRIRQSLFSTSDQRTNRPSDSDRLLHILIILMIILLILHVYLYTKLKHASLILDKLAQFLKI